MGERRGLVKVALAAVILLLLVGGVAAADRPRVRAAEAAYLEGRQVTACATRRLAPFAREERSIDELPAALEEIITDARGEAAAVRTEAAGLDTGLLPRTREAVRAVQAALAAEVELYERMVESPAEGQGDAELDRLGAANARAEARLGQARRWVFAGEAKAWDERNACQDPAG